METRPSKKVRTSTNDESSDETQTPIQKIDEDEETITDTESNDSFSTYDDRSIQDEETMSDTESNDSFSTYDDSSIQGGDEDTVNADNDDSPEETQEQIQKLNELLAEMDIKIDKAARTESSKQEEIGEYCSSLRCKVDAHSEEMIEEIRKWNEKMRDEINKYEKKCLDQFNAEEFKASSDLVKSTLSEMNDLQSRIRQQLVGAQSNAERISDLIAEASSKLVELKKIDYRMKKIKFTESMLDFDVGKKEFDPSNGARLVPTSIVSRDRMIQVSTISNMKGFKSLKRCFINPFSSPHELIALVENQSDQMVFVKMDLDGKILMQKTADNNYYRVDRLRTMKQGFIFVVYDAKNHFDYKVYDYDFNEIDQTQDNGNGVLRSELTANQSFIIKPFVVERKPERGFKYKYTELRFTRHDSSEICTSLKCDCNDGRFKDCFASDKYLFVWYKLYDQDNFCLHVYDIEHLKVDQENTGEQLSFHNRPKYIRSSLYKSYNGIHKHKVYGDKYIARYLRGSLSLFTQDSNFKLVREYEVDLSKSSGYIMSRDCSNGLCFFNPKTGEIFHNLI